MNIEITIIKEALTRNIQIKSKKPPEQESENVLKKLEDFMVNIDVLHLTSLTLSHCNLKTLPESLGVLRLNKLNISNNLIQNVPSCLYLGLKHLQDLDLSHNKIEEFVTELECVAQLKKLNLQNNKLKNLPKWILNFKCINLEVLNYSNNSAKNYDCLKSSYFKSIMQVKKLILQNSCLLDEDYIFLKCFKMLEFLDVSNDGIKLRNCFKDLDGLFVKPKWVNIKVLVLNNLSLSVFPEGLLWLESLKELYLRNNYLYFIPDSIEYLVNLEILDLSCNEISGLNDKLLTLFSLKKLYLGSNYLSRFNMVQNSLECLDLYDNFIEDFTCDIENITGLDLDQNYFDVSPLKDFNYEKKRESIRETVKDGDLRLSGLKYQHIPPESSSYSSESSCEDERIENENIENFSPQDIEENWDEPIFTTQKPQKNHLVTASDDEWEGFKSKNNKTEESKSREYIDNEALIYEDSYNDTSLVL